MKRMYSLDWRALARRICTTTQATSGRPHLYKLVTLCSACAQNMLFAVLIL